jgi:hypothetical protein
VSPLSLKSRGEEALPRISEVSQWKWEGSSLGESNLSVFMRIEKYTSFNLAILLWDIIPWKWKLQYHLKPVYTKTCIAVLFMVF